jgi:imidazoleglycerol-phosphate dehydratase
MSRVRRQTAETDVRVLFRAGAEASTGQIVVATGEPFLDHMLITFGRYAGARLEVQAAGDLRHHLIEDVGITLGVALARATPAACVRYGSATIPMDDALVHAAVDLGGRFHYRGPLPAALYDHLLRSLAEHARMTLHVRVLRGTDRHHIVEAAFKALGLAVRQALEPAGHVFSTKGRIDVTWEEDA